MILKLIPWQLWAALGLAALLWGAGELHADAVDRALETAWAGGRAEALAEVAAAQQESDRRAREAAIRTEAAQGAISEKAGREYAETIDDIDRRAAAARVQREAPGGVQRAASGSDLPGAPGAPGRAAEAAPGFGLFTIPWDQAETLMVAGEKCHAQLNALIGWHEDQAAARAAREAEGEPQQ